MTTGRLLRTPLPWLGALLVAYLLVPLIAFVVRIPGTDPATMAAPGVGDALKVSLVTATISTAVVTVLGVPLGYLLANTGGRAARWMTALGVLVQLPLALPPLISGIVLVFVVGPYTPLGRLFGGTLTDSLTGIVLAQVFVSAPFLVVSARAAFASVNPALLDVAATLGHGPLARAVRVALPVAAGGIRSGMLLAWLRAFGEFGATVVLAYHPYSLPVFTYVQFSSTGLASTTIPVAVTLGAALVVLLLADRRPRTHVNRRPRQVDVPPAEPPGAATSPRLDFALTTKLGDFTVRVRHSAAGRHLAILGPSGAGKSATLRMLAGLLPCASGHVELDGRDVRGLPPERRGIGYLPQDSTLLPQLRVWDQVMFGVGARGPLAAYWLARLRLDGLADRLPGQLSGGQARRVAMARALVRRPEVLLLDEPFTGLDAPVRDELRRTLRAMLRDTALTTVLVTHDPVEAALLADEVILLADGKVLQAGRTDEVLAHPASPAAAAILGVRNIGRGVLDAPDVLRANDFRIDLGSESGPVGAAVSWCVRPEDVLVTAEPDGHPAVITDAVPLGPVVELSLRLAGGGELTATVPNHAPNRPAVGASCGVAIRPGAVTVWPEPERTGIMVP